MTEYDNVSSLNSQLFYAAQQKNLHDIKYFLQKGANINARCRIHNVTPLIAVTIRGYTEIAMYLIEKGADIHLETHHGNTALDYAIDNLRTEIAVYLVKKGAKIMLEKKEHFIFFHLAFLHKNYDIINILVEKNEELQKIVRAWRQELDEVKKGRLENKLTTTFEMFGTL